MDVPRFTTLIAFLLVFASVANAVAIGNSTSVGVTGIENGGDGILRSGSTLYVYYSNTTVAPYTYSYIARSTDNGTTWDNDWVTLTDGTDATCNYTTAGSAMALDSGGNIHIIFTCYNPETLSQPITYRKIDSSGTTLYDYVMHENDGLARFSGIAISSNGTLMMAFATIAHYMCGYSTVDALDTWWSYDGGATFTHWDDTLNITVNNTQTLLGCGGAAADWISLAAKGSNFIITYYVRPGVGLIYVNSFNGTGWNPVDGVIPTGPNGNNWQKVCVTPSGIAHHIYAGSYDGILYHSDASNWSVITSLGVVGTTPQVRCVSDSHLYVVWANASGINAINSYNGGVSWGEGFLLTNESNQPNLASIASSSQLDMVYHNTIDNFLYYGYYGLAEDETPPVTTITGTTDDGSGYYFGFTVTNSSYINITLSCNDSGGVGCDTMLYCTDFNNTCTPSTNYTGLFQITSIGATYIRYFSNDTNNNTETTNAAIVIRFFSYNGGGQSGGATWGSDVSYESPVTVPSGYDCNFSGMPSDRVVGANTLWVQDKNLANVSLTANGTTWVQWACSNSLSPYHIHWLMPSPTANCTNATSGWVQDTGHISNLTTQFLKRNCSLTNPSSENYTNVSASLACISGWTCNQSTHSVSSLEAGISDIITEGAEGNGITISQTGWIQDTITNATPSDLTNQFIMDELNATWNRTNTMNGVAFTDFDYPTCFAGFICTGTAGTMDFSGGSTVQNNATGQGDAITEMKTATVAQNGSQAYIDENSTEYQGYIMWQISNNVSAAFHDLYAYQWTDTNATCVTNCDPVINVSGNGSTDINVTFTVPIALSNASVDVLPAFTFLKNEEYNFTLPYARQANTTFDLPDPCPLCTNFQAYYCYNAACNYSSLMGWNVAIFTKANGRVRVWNQHFSEVDFVFNWDTGKSGGGGGGGGGLPISITLPPLVTAPISGEIILEQLPALSAIDAVFKGIAAFFKREFQLAVLSATIVFTTASFIALLGLLLAAWETMNGRQANALIIIAMILLFSVMFIGIIVPKITVGG